MVGILLLITLLIVVGNKVIYKDNFAILEGNIELVQSDSGLTGTTNINYPIGFNKNNCVVISVGISGSSNLEEETYSFGDLGNKTSAYLAGAIQRNVELTSDNMIFKASFEVSGPAAQTRKYKIVLMKI